MRLAFFFRAVSIAAVCCAPQRLYAQATNTVDTALLRRALEDNGSRRGFTYRIEQHYEGSLVGVRTGHVYSDLTERFYYSETPTDIFVIGADGAVVVTHADRKRREHLFKDSADAAAYASYFPAQSFGRLFADSILYQSSIRLMKAEQPGTVRYQFVSDKTPLYDTLELDIDKRTAAVVRTLTKGKAQIASSLPSSEGWAVRQTTMVTDIAIEPSPSVLRYYNARRNLILYCSQQFSHYSPTGL